MHTNTLLVSFVQISFTIGSILATVPSWCSAIGTHCKTKLNGGGERGLINNADADIWMGSKAMVAKVTFLTD